MYKKHFAGNSFQHIRELIKADMNGASGVNNVNTGSHA